MMNGKMILKLLFIVILSQFMVVASFGQNHHSDGKQSKAIHKSNDQYNQQPSFPGGTDSLYQYLRSHIHYPPQARENNIQGRVTLYFLINETGDIENIRPIRGIGGGCIREAIRVVEGMPKWNPYIVKGVAKKMLYVLPVEFKLGY